MPGSVSTELYSVSTSGPAGTFLAAGPGPNVGATDQPATPSGTVSGGGTANSPAAQQDPLQQLLSAVDQGVAGPAGIDTSQLGGTQYLPIGGSSPVSGIAIWLLLIAAALVGYYLWKRYKKKHAGGGEHHAAAA